MKNRYLSGLSGINQLGALPKESRDLIRQNRAVVSAVLKRAEKLNGLGFLPEKHKTLFTFSEMVKRYNTGISDDEIRAWVWYRRSIGIPMYGWEKYFIDGNGGYEAHLLVTTVETVIKDNHFRDLKTVPAGTILGKRISKTHQYDRITFVFFRDSEGIRMADSKHCKEQVAQKTDRKKLDALVKSGALYYIDSDLVPYPVYAYGNMYDRIKDLERDRSFIVSTYGMDVYEKHEKVIGESKPAPLTVTNPDVKERPKILAISKFAINGEDGVDISISELRDETGITLNEKCSLQNAFRNWLSSLDKSAFDESSPYNIRQYYLDGRRLPNGLTPEQKSITKSAARNEGERLFDRFLHEALLFDDQQRIDLIWNRLYNGMSSVAHHKIPVGFECSARFQGFDFELRPAQREGIAFLEMVGSGVIAYDVGVGKTITAIAELANSIKSGKCKRPLVIVPNATYENWKKELFGVSDKSGQFIEGLLTGTDIKLNDWYNMGKDILKKIKIDRAVAEKSITLVTYEGMKKIGFGSGVADELFTELANILSQTENTNVRQAEIEYQKMREVIGVGLKDTVADIDALKFDYIVIDEAHNCKNVFSMVKKDKETGQKRFGMTGATSDTGIKTFFLTNYLQRKYGRNVMLLTATPFTNSPLEIYSMLSLVGYHGLRQMNIYSLSDFFERFVLETTEDTVNYKEEIVQKDVVKSFNNRLLLQRLIHNHINYKTGEEAGVQRPLKVNLPKVNEAKDGKVYKLPPGKQILTYLKMTVRQRENQNRIVELARTAKAGDILRAMSRSMNNAFHPCLYDNIPPDNYADFIDESPKIKYTVECIRTVKQYHQKRSEPVSGQVIYSNRGRDCFPLIKEYLEKEAGYKTGVKWNGIKIDEVEIIDSSISQTKKENIKNAFLDGVCKVIIGTATIREGINLQRKGTVIYNLYPDWNPTDLRQLEGRIWRQKNEYGFVRVVMPLLQDSMDVFIFQKLEEKTYRINDIWYRGNRGNVLDLESLDPEEVKYALLTDIEAIATSVIKREIKLQERKIAAIEDNIKTLMEYERWRRTYDQRKEGLMYQIRYWHNNVLATVRQGISPAQKNIKELLEKLTRFLEKTPVEDKEMLSIARRFHNLYPAFPNYYADNFKESLAIVAKAEKTILAGKGFTAADNIDDVIRAFRKDLEQAREHRSYLGSEKHKEEVMKEVTEKKEQMSIAGKSIEQRVKEFASLNYLLSYKFADRPADGSIPKTEKSAQAQTAQPANEDEDVALRIRVAEAEMELLNLNF